MRAVGGHIPDTGGSVNIEEATSLGMFNGKIHVSALLILSIPYYPV